VAGQVEAVGENVKQFKTGDEVFGFGINTYAEYARAKENSLVLKPANLSFEQAAAVPIAALTALQGLRDVGKIKAGQRVLIQGASGGGGMFAVQIAKAFGTEVTAVCSARNIDMVRELGADHIIDYRKEDFTQNGQPYDLILAVNGYHPIPHYLRALSPQGICAVAGGTLGQIIGGLFLGALFTRSGGKKVAGVSAKMNQADLAFLKELLEAGKIRPVIDGSYPLEKTVDAFRYFEEVHPKGKVVITTK
jgi:NADPH:quinone reductase-like Zn-dependent oxidoreductase